MVTENDNSFHDLKILALYNPKLLPAFGLMGPISGLKILNNYFSKNSFCMKTIDFCLKGRFLQNYYYFDGRQKNGSVFIVKTNYDLFAVASKDPFFKVEEYLNRFYFKEKNH